MMGSMGTEHNPKFGKTSIPHLGPLLRHTAAMELEPRQILAKNVRALMQAKPHLGTIVKLSQVSGVSKGVVERMTKAEANTGVDHLAGIAHAFGVPVWALLSDDLDAEKGVGAPAWPFDELTPNQFAQLPDRKKGMIEARALDIYQEWESASKQNAA